MAFHGDFYTSEMLKLVVPCVLVCLGSYVTMVVLIRLPLRIRKSAIVAILTAYHVIILYVTIFSREQHEEFYINTEIFRIIRHTIGYARLCLENIPNFLSAGKIFYVDGMAAHMNYIEEGVYNILLFIPQGFLAGLLILALSYNRMRLVIIEIGWTVLFVCLIELIQLISLRGTFDCGDFVHNTIGMMIGLWMSLRSDKQIECWKRARLRIKCRH